LDFAIRVGDYFYVMESGANVLHGSANDLDEGAAREYLAL
jgi:urea transport system ATP-binding protein